MQGRLLLLAIAASSIWLMSVPGSSARTPVPVVVVEGEYYIHLTGRLSAPHGAVEFDTWNAGEDDHMLYIGRGQAVRPDRPDPAGGPVSITVNLPRGTYNLLCRLPGMSAWAWSGTSR